MKMKKKDFLHKLTKVGSDIKKIHQLTSILKKAGILTGFATFAGGIATGGVGIAVVTVGIVGLALSKLLHKKKGKHHELTNEQKELLTSLLEKLMNDSTSQESQDCEKNNDKLTDKEKEQIATILMLLKHDKNDENDVNDDLKDKENKTDDINDKPNNNDNKELLDIILTLLKDKEKQKQ